MIMYTFYSKLSFHIYGNINFLLYNSLPLICNSPCIVGMFAFLVGKKRCFLL